MQIGELFVALGFDVDDQKLKDFEGKLKNTNESMIKLGTAATTAVGALALFVQHASESAVKLNNLQSLWSVNTQAAQTFANALHQINPAVGVDEAIDKYKKFSELIRVLIPQGQGGAGTAALARLGGDYQSGETPEQILENLRKNQGRILKGLSSDPAQARAIYSGLLEQIGIGGSLNALGESSAQYQSASQYNILPQANDNLLKFAQSTAKLDEAFHKFETEIAGDLAPKMKLAIDQIVLSLNFLTKFNENHPGAGTAEAVLGGGLSAGLLGKFGSKLPFVGTASSTLGSLGLIVANAITGWDIFKAAQAIYDPSQRQNSFIGRTSSSLSNWILSGNNNSFTPEQRAGIMRRLMLESGLNPGAVGDGGQAYGIAQWHPDRQANFRKWSGHDIHGTSRDEQLAFVMYELTQGMERSAGNKLRQTKTEQEAYNVFTKYYERPANANSISVVVNSTAGAKEVAIEVRRELQKLINSASAQTNLGAVR